MRSILSPISACLLLSVFIISCNEKTTETLGLKIESSEVRISSQSEPRSSPCIKACAELRYKLSNNSTRTILLYNFTGNIQFGYEDAKLNCDSVWAPMATWLNLFDETMVFIPINLPLVNGGTRYIKMKEKWDLFFRKGMVVLRPGEQKDFSEIINFRDYRLYSPGTYYVSLVYVQHAREYIEYELSPEEIDADLLSNKAILYKGCVFSNTVRLIVE